MAKRKPPKDFRAWRSLLPDEAFALINEEAYEPTDRVTEEVWNSIMHLPDDVALRTSDHHGTQLAALGRLWGDWIDSHGDDGDEELFGAMVDATDCFQSASGPAPRRPRRLARDNQAR